MQLVLKQINTSKKESKKLEYQKEGSTTESEEPKPKRAKRTKLKTAKKLDQKQQPREIRKTIRTRTSPKTLYNAIHELTDVQRAAVIHMGFEQLLGLSVDEIPSKLGYYVVDNFNDEHMRLDVHKFSIPISRQSVHDMLGIPMGTTRLQDVMNADEEESSITVFKQIHGKENVTPNDIVRYLTISKRDDWYFKMNFITLVANIFGETMQNGNCNLSVLTHIKSTTNISEIDWCSYILECLPRTKKAWNRDNPNSKFSGPLTFLVVCFNS